MRDKAYRRHQHRIHDKRWRENAKTSYRRPFMGYIVKDGTYMRDFSKSNMLQFLKKEANGRVRRSSELYQGSEYKKAYEIWYTMY